MSTDGPFKISHLASFFILSAPPRRSSIRDKVFIPGSMTRLALSNHFRDVGTIPHACTILAFHPEDPASPSGLSSEPYPSTSRLAEAVLSEGRSMACVLSPLASKGVLLRRAGDAGAGDAVRGPE